MSRYLIKVSSAKFRGKYSRETVNYICQPSVNLSKYFFFLERGEIYGNFSAVLLPLFTIDFLKINHH